MCVFGQFCRIFLKIFTACPLTMTAGLALKSKCWGSTTQLVDTKWVKKHKLHGNHCFWVWFWNPKLITNQNVGSILQKEVMDPQTPLSYSTTPEWETFILKTLTSFSSCLPGPQVDHRCPKCSCLPDTSTTITNHTTSIGNKNNELLKWNVFGRTEIWVVLDAF